MSKATSLSISVGVFGLLSTLMTATTWHWSRRPPHSSVQGSGSHRSWAAVLSRGFGKITSRAAQPA
jgi:hypothetical protein